MKHASPLLAPLDPAIWKGMLKGGVAVPWSAWMTPIIYWSFFYISFFMLCLFVATLLRRQYVEVEALPFPLASAVDQVNTMSTTGERAQLFTAKAIPFWIGLIISFAIGMCKKAGGLGGVLPMLGWYLDSLWVDLTPLALMSGPLLLNFEPWLIGLGYLNSFDILVTLIISTVILFWIIPNLLVAAGLTAALAPGRGCGHTYEMLVFSLNTSGSWGPTPFRWGYVGLFIGLTIGVVFYPIIIHRKILLRSIKGIFSKAESENGDVSYRLQWIGTIIFGILWLISLVLINIPIHYAILGAFIVIVIFIGWSRMRAMSGGLLGGYGRPLGHYMQFPAWIPIGTGLSKADPSASLSFMSIFGGHLLAGGLVGTQLANPMPNALESYRVGFLAKARSRDLFIAQIIALVVSIPIIIMITIWWYYTYGALSDFRSTIAMHRHSVANNVAYTIMKTGEMTNLGNPDYFTLGMIILGIVLAVGMYVARERYPRFILVPTGVMLAISSFVALFMPFVIALIAKWLTLRVGGVKLYEEKGAPIAVGLIFGVGLAYAFSAFLDVFNITV
ncbi:hypothetical protein DRO64_06110 [Candidatus Bathyarchaeota archaeon]|nr:MAG: hypothetical protein DRO64_06110 [Candidatus Bathyarchaeota archaeon]